MLSVCMFISNLFRCNILFFCQDGHLATYVAQVHDVDESGCCGKPPLFFNVADEMITACVELGSSSFWMGMCTTSEDEGVAVNHRLCSMVRIDSRECSGHANLHRLHDGCCTWLWVSCACFFCSAANWRLQSSHRLTMSMKVVAAVNHRSFLMLRTK